MQNLRSAKRTSTQSLNVMRIPIMITAIIIGLMISSAWMTKPQSDIKKAEWILGTWKNKTSKGNIFETWHKENDQAFLGKSYVIKEKDTIVFENIRLVQQENGLFYIPTVKSQNGGLPVSFAATTVTEERLVFENRQHDFPQIISYTRINADSLLAEISGMRNGQERKQTFPMKKLRR